jgi:phosphatidylinositol-3-phosphatase
VIALRRGAILLGLSLLAGACATPPTSSGSPSARATARLSPAPSASPSPTPIHAHVFVIVLENRSYQQALADPNVAQLAARYGLATNYHAVASPSLPNYLAMTSGSTWGIRDDSYHQLPLTGLGSELSSAGISWRAYMEGFDGDCYNSPYPYSLKHNPFAYYGARCPAEVVAMTQLAQDLQGETPHLAWITPGLCHDGHDCSSAVAGRWLAAAVRQITSSPAWQQDGTLYVTWDESSGLGDQVPLLVVAPTMARQKSGEYLDHFSLAGTIADQLGVPRPGQSTGSRSIVDAFGLTTS